jgi:putative hydrolase of the HAD superfamily
LTAVGSPAVVLFDGDQTLWDFEKVMRVALSAVLDELKEVRPGPAAATLTVADLSADRAQVGRELEGKEFNLERLRFLSFRRTIEGLDPQATAADNDALAADLAASYFRHRDRDPALFDDTLPCLQVLKGRYRLGLLSNGSRLPETVGLAGIFEVVVFAQDHRAVKPDRALFAVAERLLDVPPQRCILVGDHEMNDVVGAKRSGWRAVWIDRRGGGTYACPQGCTEEPDAIISSLSELGAVLAKW